ncbi:uncharacterized protein LOC132738354 [Ruditapes philippinarum]|uniref:uncharacterized protein LOC132738354 n=1 Tax=Ruditapes philippinarum TaxID=129788 RepID=UPI00295B874C|nr:uncharacterized protein LOC132738354 [Ruditapes philippinarum]
MATGHVDTDIFTDETLVLCSSCKNRDKNTECVECHDYFCVKCLQLHNQDHHKVLEDNQVKSVLDESHVKSVLDESQVKSVLDESQVKSVLDESQVKSVLDETLVKSVMDESQVKSVLDETQVKSVLYETQVKSVLDESQVKSVLDESQVKSVLDETQVNSVLDESQVQSVLDESELKSVLDESQVKSVLDKSQVKSVLDESQVKSVLDKSQVKSVLDESKVKSVLDESQVQSVLDESQVKSGIGESLTSRSEEHCDKQSHKHIDMYCQNHDQVGCSSYTSDEHGAGLTCANQDEEKLQQRMSELQEKEFLTSGVNKEGSIKISPLQINKAEGTLDEESPNRNQTEAFVDIKITLDGETSHVVNKCLEDTKKKSATVDKESQPDGEKPTSLLEEVNTIDVVTEGTTDVARHLLQMTANMSFCVKVKSDKDVCNIVCACFMEDDTIIIADNNNRKLKRLDSNNYNVTDYCDISKDPRQICTINESQVAVTLGSEKEVRFISLEEEMRTANRFKTGFNCYGIAYSGDKLYISDISRALYIYTLSGEQLKKISAGALGSGLFSDISSLAVSRDASKIYIADYFYGFIVLRKKPSVRVLKKFNDKQLKEANSCYLTEAGSVLVSGEKTNNVLLFAPNGNLVGEVVKADDGKESVQSVCCNKQMSKMCISRMYENSIDIYKVND